MRFLYGTLFLSKKGFDCSQCVHFNPVYYDNTWELSTCKKFNERYADMCRMDEGKCGKGGHYFLPKNETKEPDRKEFSMELDCI